LDAERLVDGKGDVEEIEAVDLEIVDGVTFGLDIFTRNVASFRNDFSHFIERGGHQTCSFRPRRGWTPARSGACQPARAGPPWDANAPYSEGCRQVQRRASGGKSAPVPGDKTLCRLWDCSRRGSGPRLVRSRERRQHRGCGTSAGLHRNMGGNGRELMRYALGL